MSPSIGLPRGTTEIPKTGPLYGSPRYLTGSPPMNQILPVLSGTPTVGQTLEVTDGSWFGYPYIFGYHWLYYPSLSIVPGSSINDDFYLLDSGDIGKRFIVSVECGNDEGTTIAYSNVIGPVT